MNVRFPPDHLAANDKFMAEHPDTLTRPSAVRIIVSEWLRERGYRDAGWIAPAPSPKTQIIPADVKAAADRAEKRARENSDAVSATYPQTRQGGCSVG